MLVYVGGRIKVACLCADGSTFDLSDAFGILNGSATSILGLRCFDCLNVDVLAANLVDVVSCGITGADAGVTVGCIVVDVSTFDSCGCVNCDVLTATARFICGFLEPLHQSGVGGYILDDDVLDDDVLDDDVLDNNVLDGGCVTTGVTDVTSGIAGVPTCSIGFIIGAAGVGAGFNGTTSSLPGISVGIVDVAAGVTGTGFDFDDCGACSSIFLLNCGPIAGTSGSDCELVSCSADGVDIG